MLAWTLLGQPGAWVAGMPIIGLVADVDWRLAFAVPFTAAATALVAVRRRARGRESGVGGAEVGSGTSIWRRPDVVGWAVGELMAFTAWSGVLVYIGALMIESYELTTRATGLLLAAAAVAYFPASFATQRFIARHARTVLITLGLTAAAGTALLGTLRPGALFTTALFALIVAAVGGRTLAASAFGLQSAPDDRVAISATRAGVTQLGYFAGAAARRSRPGRRRIFSAHARPGGGVRARRHPAHRARHGGRTGAARRPCRHRSRYALPRIYLLIMSKQTETMLLVPVDDSVVFPNMTVTLAIDVGDEERVVLVPRKGDEFA